MIWLDFAHFCLFDGKFWVLIMQQKMTVEITDIKQLEGLADDFEEEKQTINHPLNF